MSTGGFGDESPGFEQDGPTLFPDLDQPRKPDDPADSGVWADARQRATFQNQGVHEALRPVAPLLRTAGDLIAAVSAGIGRPGEWAAAAKTWREEYQVWLSAYVEGERIRLGIRDGER